MILLSWWTYLSIGVDNTDEMDIFHIYSFSTQIPVFINFMKA